MKKKLLRSLVAFSLLLGFGLTACNNGGGEGGNSSQQQSSSAAQQEKITITAEGGKKSLILGETVKLTASVEGVAWESKNPEVATVDQTGLVTSVSKGSTSISATKEGYKGGSISISVDYETIKITAPADTSMLVGGTIQLSADKAGVTWASSDQAVATVDQNGKVTGVSYGKATITASGDKLNAGSVEVSVVRPAPTAVLHMEDADHYSADGMWGTSYGSTIYGPGEESPVYARSSGNASDGTCIAYMANGDKEVLTFTSSDAAKAELVIMMASRSAVSDMSTIMNVKFNSTAIDLAGKAFEGGGDTNTFVEFSLGEVDIVKGENILDFEFLGSSPYMDDVNIYAEKAITATVVLPAEKDPVVLKQENLRIEEGKTAQIESDMTGLSYKSNGTSIATVNETGLVTGVAAGSTTISVSKDGYKTVKLPVEVVEAEGVFNVSIAGITGEGITTKESQNLTAPDNVIIDTFEVDAVGTLEFNAEKAGTFTMYMKARASGGYSATESNDLATCMELKVNGTKVEMSGTVAPSSFATYLLGDVTLAAGKNTIEIKCISAVPGINLFKFIPKA